MRIAYFSFFHSHWAAMFLEFKLWSVTCDYVKFADGVAAFKCI